MERFLFCCVDLACVKEAEENKQTQTGERCNVQKGVTRADTIKNQDIRSELRMNSVLNFINRNKLKWFNHVNRLEEDRLVKS